MGSFMIGRNDSVSAEDLAELVVKRCDSSSVIKRVPAEPAVISIKRAACEMAKSALGCQAQATLDERADQLIGSLQSS